MSEEVKEEKKEEKVNPFLTPVKIIEPEHKLPDYTFDMLPEEQKAVLAQHGWTDLMPVQRKTIPYMLAARDMLGQSRPYFPAGPHSGADSRTLRAGSGRN